MERLALRILRRIGPERLSGASTDGTVVSLDDLSGGEADLSAKDYAACVRLLLRQWGIHDPDLRMVERLWLTELQSSPEGVSVSRLRSLARDCSSGFYKVTDTIAAWRHRLTFRLTQLRLSASLSDSNTTHSPEELDLSGVGQEWPAELLNGHLYCSIPALLPELPDLPLDGTWVELQFAGEHFSERLERMETWPAPLEERSLRLLGRSVDLRLVLQEISGLTYIVGDPGSGKSTLVNWIARETVRDEGSPFLLPLLVRLREYGIQTPKEGLLAHALRKCGVRADNQITQWTRALDSLVKDDPQSVLLLLDGLDELPGNDETIRQKVLYELEDLARRYTVLVTSRPRAAPPQRRGSKYRTYRITDLSPASSDTLLDQWCSAAGMQPAQIAPVKTQIALHQDLFLMSRNPFLLTCICSIAARSLSPASRLPTRRSDIYRECLDLIRRQHYEKQTRPFEKSDMRLMARLALWLLRDAPDAPRLVFDLGDVKEACENVDFFRDVVEPSRLVSQWDVDDASLYFAHATFHEYLAAEQLVSPQVSPDELVQLLRERCFDRNWSEVFAFLGARQTNPESLFWCNARRLASHPDRFGGVFIFLARWLLEAGAQDGGNELLRGIDVREELWNRIFEEVDSARFMTACAHLDPEWFAARFEHAAASGEVGRLHREFLRVLKQARIPRFSEVFVNELLNPAHDSSGLPQEHRLTPDSLAYLRRELESGKHEERVARRVIQVLGLAKDHGAIPLLARIARAPSPLQSTAIEALGLLGGLDAFKALTGILNRRSTEAEWHLAVGGLGNMHEERSRDRLLLELACMDVDDEKAEEVLCALQDHPISRDATTVLRFLRSKNDSTRDYAACVLYEAKTTPEIAQALCDVARGDATDTVRQSALLSFEHHVRPSDYDWLSQVVKNETLDIEERDAALMALGDILDRDPRCASAVTDILDYSLTQNGLEKSAVNIWGRLGDARSGRLIDICEMAFPRQHAGSATASGNDVVIEEACRVLGELGSRESLGVLTRMIRDERIHFRLREAAARAVTLIEPVKLLDEPSKVAQSVLGKFCLETGRLVLDAGILDSRGRLVPLLYSGVPEVDGIENVIGVSDERRVADVVFVHGLDGGATSTWHPKDRPELFWPKWIGDAFPSVAVWSLGYKALSIGWGGTCMPLTDRATTVLAMLETVGIGERPVIFVAHCLGGLIVKQALRHSSDFGNDDWKRIATNTKGIVFIATPHTGPETPHTDPDLGEYLNYVGTVLRTTVTVSQLRTHEAALRELNFWFRNNCARTGIRVEVLFETQPTFGVTVVHATSADPGIAGVIPIPVDADHISICKPDSETHPVFARTKLFIEKVLGS
jgi:HEAT repeat protein